MSKRIGINKRVELKEMDRPLDALIPPQKEESLKDKCMKYKEVKRKTCVMDPVSIEALHIYSFNNRKGISQMVLDMLIRCIPEDVWTEARQIVMKDVDTPDDYLEDLEKLTIDDIYYHDYKVKK